MIGLRVPRYGPRLPYSTLSRSVTCWHAKDPLGIVSQDLRLHRLIHVCLEDAMQLEVLIEERALAPEEYLVVPDLLQHFLDEVLAVDT